MRIFPVALIQDQSLIQRMAVQEDIGAVNADLSHCKIGTNGIENLAVRYNLKSDIVQIRALRAPGTNAPLHAAVGLAIGLVENVDFRLCMVRSHNRHGLADEHITKGNSGNYHEISSSHCTFRSVDLILDLQCHIMKVRGHFHIIQTDVGHILGPYGLPDTGGLYIPTTEILIDPALFSTGLLSIEGIFHFNDQFVLAILHKLCDIKGKTCIATLVVSGVSAVHP